RKIPSESRLVELKDKHGRTVPKIQRVYPWSEALQWFEELQDSDVDERVRRQHAVVAYAARAAERGLTLKTDGTVGRRNPWVPFVAALLAESLRGAADGPGHVVRLFIANRKPRWQAERTDSRAIADELAIQLDLSRNL